MTQTVPDISPLMPMHQDPLLVAMITGNPWRGVPGHKHINSLWRVSKLTAIVSDNGLSPVRRQAIIWTNAGILLIGPLETNVNEVLIEIERQNTITWANDDPNLCRHMVSPGRNKLLMYLYRFHRKKTYVLQWSQSISVCTINKNNGNVKRQYLRLSIYRGTI